MIKVELKNGSKAIIRDATLDDAVQFVDIQYFISKENRFMGTQPNEFCEYGCTLFN